MTNNTVAEHLSEDFYPSRIDSNSAIYKRLEPVVYRRRPVGPYSLTEKQLDQYDRYGYLLIKNCITAGWIEILQQELDCLAMDPGIHKREYVITEPDSCEVRSLFNLPQLSPAFEHIARSRRLLDIVMQLLGGPVYLHQSRINIKPAFYGKSFPWHSDFETWHVEDGLPAMRCLSCSIFLTENNMFNGPLFVIPGSHKQYISCPGKTPENHYLRSLQRQRYGSPKTGIIKQLLQSARIEGCFGRPGDLLIFDGNIMHGSPDNISHQPRTNMFLAYNSCFNQPRKPYCGLDRRPEFLASRDFTPLAVI